MGAYASLKIWKPLHSQENSLNGNVYSDIYQMLQKGMNEEEIYEKLGLDYSDFGSIIFETFYAQTYFHHRPIGFLKRDRVVKEYKYHLPEHWLVFFSYSDFSVNGGEGWGQFGALTSVKKAIENIRSISFKEKTLKSKEFYAELIKLIQFLEIHHPDDLLCLSSEDIYENLGTTNGKDYVKNIINEKIKKVKEIVFVPHWRKGQ